MSGIVISTRTPSEEPARNPSETGGFRAPRRRPDGPALDELGRDATLDVQWSHDLGVSDLWSGNVAAVPVPPGGTVNDVVFTVTENAGDNTLDDVVATIPAGEASGGRLFGRVEGTEN